LRSYGQSGSISKADEEDKCVPFLLRLSSQFMGAVFSRKDKVTAAPANAPSDFILIPEPDFLQKDKDYVFVVCSYIRKAHARP
jgi:hypothetical protein